MIGQAVTEFTALSTQSVTMPSDGRGTGDTGTGLLVSTGSTGSLVNTSARPRKQDSMNIAAKTPHPGTECRGSGTVAGDPVGESGACASDTEATTHRGSDAHISCGTDCVKGKDSLCDTPVSCGTDCVKGKDSLCDTRVSSGTGCVKGKD